MLPIMISRAPTMRFQHFLLACFAEFHLPISVTFSTPTPGHNSCRILLAEANQNLFVVLAH